MKDPIYIKIVQPGSFDYENHSYEKNIEDTTYAERVAYYTSISKGQIFGLLEKVLKGVKYE